MQKIAALYDASQAVIATFDLDEVLNQIVAIVRDYFHLQHVAILLLDSDTRLLKLRTHHGWDKTGEPSEVAFGQGLIGAAAQCKRPVYVPDVSRDSRYLRGIDSTRSELAIPLLVRGEVAGVLDCQSEKLGFFDEETVNLLTLFSTQASIAMENARLYSLEQRKARQLEAINAIARQTTAVLELHELLETACAHILQSFAVDHVAMLVREDHALVLRAHQGRLTTRFPLGVQLTPGAGLCARALESGKPVVENDVNAVPGYIAGFVETRSEMCLPMVCFGQIVGVLALESAQPGAFQNSDVQPLESVADICANAIQNARYFDRMRQMAYVDGLTGIFNRRYFELRIRQEIERVQRYQGSLSIIMIDIDQFKSINDEFGHLLGDEVLRQVCGIFSQQLRRVDVACRYGGEEFAILAPETSGEAALALAEKLRRTVETWSFTGVPRPVTISAGVATLSLQQATRDELVRAADAALYAAKQAGRNRVLPASPGSFVKA